MPGEKAPVSWAVARPRTSRRTSNRCSAWGPMELPHPSRTGPFFVGGFFVSTVSCKETIQHGGGTQNSRRTNFWGLVVCRNEKCTPASRCSGTSHFPRIFSAAYGGPRYEVSRSGMAQGLPNPHPKPNPNPNPSPNPNARDLRRPTKMLGVFFSLQAVLPFLITDCVSIDREFQER